MKQATLLCLCMLVAAALAGCAHRAEFGVNVGNWTSASVQVVVSLRSEDRVAPELFNHTFAAAPHNHSETIFLAVESDFYVASAWTTNLSASTKVDLGNSVRFLQVLVQPTTITIGLVQV